MKAILLLCLFCLISTSAFSTPRFAHIFGNHLVVQRDKEIVVWGTGADPTTAIVVRFGSEVVKADVSPEGGWRTRFPARSADSNSETIVLLEDGEEVSRLEDVLVGDVWLAAGQSNMQMQVSGMLKGLPQSESWIDAADTPEVRFRRVNDPVLEDRKREASDLSEGSEWVPMSPSTVLKFSAVAAVFASEIYASLKVPVGVVDVSWGGKPIEPFLPIEAFRGEPLASIRELAMGNRLKELAVTRGGVIIRNPEGHPAAIFNARMAPWTQVPFRGFLWYQGESNAGKGEDPRDYRKKQAAMVKGWRSRWGDKTLPFYYVQLPSYPSATGWIRMREEQRLSLRIPNSGMAVTIDIRGEGIHPPDKITVGNRLAEVAMADTYGISDREPSGPTYQSHEREGSSLRVQFSNSDGGLIVGNKPVFSNVESSSEMKLKWFELAGDDGAWFPAEATIDGEAVIVKSDEVPKPVAVRYACDTSPQGGNLYNRAKLPASPFCSDLKFLPWEDVTPQ